MNNFKQTVINTWGDQGHDWLTRLPSIIEFLSSYWNLDKINPVNNMSYNYVAFAIQSNKTPIVLKISCDSQLISDEYNALKHFNGKGAINVFDIHKEKYALLLEQAIPGRLLKDHPPSKINDTINIYSNVVQSLLNHPVSNNHSFTHVSQWCNAIDRIQDQRISQRYIQKADQLRTFLLNSADNEYICHGDLHLENIILHGKTWLAIDPKGIIGEKAFEAAAFYLVDKNEMHNLNPEIISNRITLLSNALHLNYDRLLSWIFLRVIISAQWFIEDNGDPSEMLSLAKYLYPFIEKRQ